MHPPVTHRRALKGLRLHQVGPKTQRPHVGGQVGQPQRPLKVPEVFKQPRPVGPVGHLPVLLRREAGGDKVLDLSRRIDGRDHPVARAGQSAGVFDDLAQHGSEVEAGADLQTGCAQPGDAVPQHLVFSIQLLAILQSHPLVRSSDSDPALPNPNTANTSIW